MTRRVMTKYLDWHAECLRLGYREDVLGMRVAPMGAGRLVPASVAYEGDELRGAMWTDPLDGSDVGYIDEEVRSPIGGIPVPDGNAPTPTVTVGSHCKCWDRGEACCYCGSDDDSGTFGVCNADRTGKQCRGVNRE